MKTQAAVLYNMGLPAPYAQSQPLAVTNVDLSGPGPGEVLVEVVAAGLCHSDLSVINGSRPRVMPMVLGHEAAGIVREVGADVSGLAPDDHVVFSFVPMCGRCIPCQGGHPALCEQGNQANTLGCLLGGQHHFHDDQGRMLNHHLGVSAFSQFTVVAQASLIRIEADIPLGKAALFGCAVLTGVGAVVNTASVAPGSGVAVFGMGGVGLSAIMGAKVTGAYPIIAVDLLDSKLDLARQAGATHVVNAANDDPVEAIKTLTAGGVGYAFESVGNEKVLAQAYHATGRMGTTVAIGLPHPSKMFSVPATTLVGEGRTVKGSYMGSAVPRRDIPRFIKLYQAGLLPVDLLHTRTIVLDEINHAFDQLAAGEAVRQVVRF